MVPQSRRGQHDQHYMKEIGLFTVIHRWISAARLPTEFFFLHLILFIPLAKTATESWREELQVSLFSEL